MDLPSLTTENFGKDSEAILGLCYNQETTYMHYMYEKQV